MQYSRLNDKTFYCLETWK